MVTVPKSAVPVLAVRVAVAVWDAPRSTAVRVKTTGELEQRCTGSVKLPFDPRTARAINGLPGQRDISSFYIDHHRSQVLVVQGRPYIDTPQQGSAWAHHLQQQTDAFGDQSLTIHPPAVAEKLPFNTRGNSWMLTKLADPAAVMVLLDPVK